MKTVNEFKKKKHSGIPISVVTCYDFWSSLIINDSDIDAVLVGDSAAMVMHGFETTIFAEVEMMKYHIAAVNRGLRDKLLIADFPFLAHRKGLRFAMESVDQFMKQGANAVKIEGAGDTVKTIKQIVDSGIPVMGHIGLTPQSVNSLGGFNLQGKDSVSAKYLVDAGKSLQEAGCFSIVLEMVPSSLAKEITDTLQIPTIGIGAGVHTSGQVLVLQDLLGMLKNFNPKFLRKYLNGYDLIKNALNQFAMDVESGSYPNESESY